MEKKNTLLAVDGGQAFCSYKNNFVIDITIPKKMKTQAQGSISPLVFLLLWFAVILDLEIRSTCLLILILLIVGMVWSHGIDSKSQHE